MKRILCIQLENWPVQRIRVARPELERQALVLDEARRGSRRVAACSAEARALGVRVGMPSAEATALVGSTALCREDYEPSADREALEALAVWCERFSPLVGLDDALAPDSLLLDVTGLGRLFGGEASLAERVVGDFASRKLAVRAAVADTIGAAWAMAHFGRVRSRNGLGALAIIPPGETSTALRPLPVEALRLPDDVVTLLHQLGIYQIGQLEPLPRADFTSRFGSRLLERWDQATGRRAEPVPAHPLPPELHARRSLEHPITRRKTVERLLEQLIAEVARGLVRCGRGVVRLDCRLECPSAERVDLSVGLFQPTAFPRQLFELARMQLERVWLPGPVSAVSVEAAVTAPLERRQGGLFEDGGGWRRPHQLAGLVNRLTARLGRNSVLRPRLVSDAQPELAYRYDSLVDVSSTRRSRRDGWLRSTPATMSRKRSETELPPRPLRLLAQPVPLAAVSIMPDGPPIGFHDQGRPQRIVHTWGPERIETGWWRGRPVRRDYYRVETTTGRRYWLFRQLDDGRWYLHGTFE
jgi:protein ImuB